MSKEITYGESNKQALMAEAYQHAQYALLMLRVIPEDMRDAEWQIRVNEMEEIMKRQKAND